MNTFRTTTLAALALASTLLATGCSSDSKSSSTTSAAAATAATTAASTAASGSVLTISNFQFGALTVAAGTEITIKNDDSAKHTVTADDKSFSVEVPGTGTATLTIVTPGTYSIHCEIHTSMKGTIIVS